MKKPMLIFAVETSCDDTSVCIMTNNKKILSHITHSQNEHARFGGIVPELASRSHLSILQKISKKALLEAKIQFKDIDYFCATCGPGLIGSLLVGSIFCKSLSIGGNKPFYPINHLEGHILSTSFNNRITYPHLVVLLTGGHTQIYLMHKVGVYEILGETLDDAIGEAFDKVGKLLGLSFPGGPKIEKEALLGKPNRFDLPHPLLKEKNLNFSFSGIKNYVNQLIKKHYPLDENFVKDLSASFQKKMFEIVEDKILCCLKELAKRKIEISQISIVGGVSANNYINYSLSKSLAKKNIDLLKPEKEMTGDNAAMIAWACNKRIASSEPNLFFKPDPRLELPQ